MVNVLEFTSYKEKEEKLQSCSLVKSRGNKGKSSTIFYCHRAGKKRSRSTGKRCEKSQESNKTGFACPATMVKYVVDENITVTYQKYHNGHNKSDGRINLNETEKNILAG